MPPPTIYCGDFLHHPSTYPTPNPSAYEVLEDRAVFVNEAGVIISIYSLPEVGNWLQLQGLQDQTDSLVKEGKVGKEWEDPAKWKIVDGRGLEEMQEEERGGGKDGGRRSKVRWFAPGFVDTHIHASQFPNAGVFGNSTLLSWLQKYTFPLESSLADTAKARKVYNRAVAASLRSGTTTASYYATTHVDSTNILAEIAHKKGQRAFIGRCNMDREGVNEDYYRDASADSAIADTIATVDFCESLGDGPDPAKSGGGLSEDRKSESLVKAIVTPRFAPSCTPECLAGLGALARERDLPIQTHISENTNECELVGKLFPDIKGYAMVYDHFGLLTNKTVLAHAIHLTDDERVLIRIRDVGISHCPVSNTSLSSGLCPVRSLLDTGIDVGLGTDVSGGYSSSILVAAREASMVSRILSDIQKAEGKRQSERAKLSPEECLYLATRGGARCLGLDEKVGRFEVGMEWDAQLIEVELVKETLEEEMELVDDDPGPVQLWGGEGWGDRIAKWIFCGDDRNTKMVWVKGKLVHERK